jgi:hypothetical protein
MEYRSKRGNLSTKALLSREQVTAVYLCGMTLAGSGAVELSLTMSFGRVTLLLRLDEGRVLLAPPEDEASAALVAALIAYPMFFATCSRTGAGAGRGALSSP